MIRIFKNLMMTTLVISGLQASAQTDSAKSSTSHSIKMEMNPKAPIGKAYWGNSLDGMIFSTALIDNAGNKSLGTLRFSMFLHLGATYNYNFGNAFGIYTGIDLKNIGFIEKFDINEATYKHRVYALGVPVGLRLGNMKTRSYFFLGGGLDVAMQYKEKFWYKNQSKVKSNDWFSKKSNILMPYVFAGVALKGTTIKVQYYPTNFFNEDYIAGYDNTIPGSPVAIKPYSNKQVNLLLVSLGRDIKFSKKK